MYHKTWLWFDFEKLRHVSAATTLIRRAGNVVCHELLFEVFSACLAGAHWPDLGTIEPAPQKTFHISLIFAIDFFFGEESCDGFCTHDNRGAWRHFFTPFFTSALHSKNVWRVGPGRVSSARWKYYLPSFLFCKYLPPPSPVSVFLDEG